MFNLFSTETKAYKSLSGKEFKAAYSKSEQPVLLDVRTPAEFASGSIKNSKNIDIFSTDFNSHISTLDKDKDYFLFCRSGNRSAQACGILAKQGFNAYNLEGGIGAWPG